MQAMLLSSCEVKQSTTSRKTEKKVLILIFIVINIQLLKLYCRLNCLDEICKNMNGQQSWEMTSGDVSDAFFTLTNQTWGQPGPPVKDGNSKRRVSRIKPLGSVMNLQQNVRRIFFFSLPHVGNVSAAGR